MKILFLLDAAPDYRELFLRELGKKCDLTVVSYPSSFYKLTPPDKRLNYSYLQLNPGDETSKYLNNGLSSIIRSEKPDIVCASLNLKYPARIADFLRQKKHVPWIWWGQIFGRLSFLDPVKKLLVNLADGTLVYSNDIKNRLNNDRVISFNNSQHSVNDFRKTKNVIGKQIHCLFVGRPQERKKLHLAVKFAFEREDIVIRLVGPGMLSYFNGSKLPKNIQLYDAAYGKELAAHFSWANAVLNPGHAGLLVMNAAAHNRPIIINSSVKHAPEIELAKRSNQFFTDFEDRAHLHTLFNKFFDNSNLLQRKGDQLYELAKSEYTVEYMVESHLKMFEKLESEN